jgi:hypothetical protein
MWGGNRVLSSPMSAALTPPLPNMGEERGREETGSLYRSLGRHLKIVTAYSEAQEHYERALDEE